MEKYRFRSGDYSNGFRNEIEIQIKSKQKSGTTDTCVVDIPMYLIGQRDFICKSGNKYRLTQVDMNKINFILRTKSGLKTFTSNSLAMARVKLETLMLKHISEFGDWKDCVNWACAELDIPMEALEFMYPTVADYLAITEFKNIRN